MCIVLQNYGLVKRGRNCINFSVPEVKILIVVSCFIVFATVALVNLGVSTDESEAFLDDVFRYTTCQLGGYNPMCEDIRQQFKKHLYPELDIITYLCLGLLSWIYLLFAIQIQDIKRLLQGMLSCYHGIAKVSSSKTKSTSDKSVKSSATPRHVEP